jgi:lysophospholipase L1-like esterase
VTTARFRWLQHLSTLAAALLVGACLVEVGLRLWAPVAYREPSRGGEPSEWRSLLHRRSEIAGLVYELVPGARGTRSNENLVINRFGMRDDEPLVAGPDLRRIVVVGDSMAFGFGIVDAADTFPNVLERRLRETFAGEPGRYEVLNLAVGGYSSRDEAAVVAARVPPLAPDLLILAYSLNDPEIDPIQPLHAHFEPVAWWRHLHFARLIAGARNDAEIRRWGGGSYYLYLHREPRKWGSVQEAFARIAQVAKREGFPVLLAIVPLIPEPTSAAAADWASRYRFANVHRQVADEGRRHGFAVLDLYPALAPHAPEVLRVAPDDLHPSVLGHRLIAEALLAEVAALPSLSPPGQR